jgi:hypothetical protein
MDAFASPRAIGGLPAEPCGFHAPLAFLNAERPRDLHGLVGEKRRKRRPGRSSWSRHCGLWSESPKPSCRRCRPSGRIAAAIGRNRRGYSGLGKSGRSLRPIPRLAITGKWLRKPMSMAVDCITTFDPSLATVVPVVRSMRRLAPAGERRRILFLCPEFPYAIDWDSGPLKPRARDPAAGGASSRSLFEVQRQTATGRCRPWDTGVAQAVQALQPVISVAAVRSRDRA